MKKEEKQKEFSRILPLIWASYQHMYDVRVNTSQDSRNFLLIVISFILAISISLFLRFGNVFLLFPLFLQLSALVILFKTLFIKTIVHWFEYKRTLKDIEKKEFDKNLFITLKTLENWTWVYQKDVRKITETSLYLIIISIYLTLLIFVGMNFTSPLNCIGYSIITIFTLILFGYYKKQPKYEYEKEHRKVMDEFDKWLGN